MIKIDGKRVNLDSFPDGTMLLKQTTELEQIAHKYVLISWHYENDRELVALIFLVRHLRENGVENIRLCMPYIPNARMDRVKDRSDVFTLKYFAEIINSLGFERIYTLDPHSNVAPALIDRITVHSPANHISAILDKISSPLDGNLLMFYPDEGSMKRYSGMIAMPYAFGIKKRDWATGAIQGLDVAGDVESIAGKDILIVDDICSRGGTFYHSAKKLKELGARDIYLYVSHCENTILDGDLLKGDLIKRVFTTDSIFTKKHEKVEVFLW